MQSTALSQKEIKREKKVLRALSVQCGGGLPLVRRDLIKATDVEHRREVRSIAIYFFHYFFYSEKGQASSKAQEALALTYVASATKIHCLE